MPKKAADLDDPLGCGQRNTAIFYQLGKGGVEQNYALALQYYQKAFAKNKDHQLVALEYIADLYYKGGPGLPQDLMQTGQALAMFIKHKGNLSDRSLLIYADLQFHGTGGILQNKPEVIKTLMKLAYAQTKESEHAAYNLALLYFNKLIDEPSKYGLDSITIELLLQKALPSNKYVYFLLGLFYLNEPSFPKHEQQAYAAFYQGAALSEPDCLYKIGNYYEFGLLAPEIPVDDAIAYKYYEKAA